MEIGIKGHLIYIDEEDYTRVTSRNWYVGTDPKHTYFYTYIYVSGIRKSIALHRFLMGCTHGDKIVIDHINRNALDNRKCNLRKCTQRDNLCNSGIRIDNSSGYKGVSFNKKENNWNATIQYNGEIYSIGTAATAQEAAVLYDMVAIRMFGEYANPNFKDASYSDTVLDSVYNRVLKRMSCANTSGYFGVYHHVRDNIWSAIINHNKVRYYIGTFSNPEDAARARDRKALELLEDKAKLNFPKEEYIKELQGEQKTEN